MLIILQHEIQRLKNAPHTWLLLAVTQFVLAWSFLTRLEIWISRQDELAIKNSFFGVTDFMLIPQFQLALVLITLTLPLFCASAFAGEKQQQTWLLLASSPQPLHHIIIGKFIALLTYCSAILMMVLVISLCLNWHTSLDYGQLVASAVLFLLTCCALTLIGLFISSCFSNFVPALVVTLLLFLLLFNTNWLQIDSNNIVLNWLSFKEHQYSAQRGLLNSYDILFFISISFIFYILTFIKLDKQRL